MLPDMKLQKRGYNFMKYYLITGRIPETETEPAHDSKIEIGETNPFDTSGIPFLIKMHMSLGIGTVEDWKRLIYIYGTKITHTFEISPDGLRQTVGGDVVPSHYLISLLHDGFSKFSENGKIIYSKQKGRIENGDGTIVSIEDILALMDIK
jgi:hypothetical protein